MTQMLATQTLAAQILDAARARGWRIATAESCTGGMVAVALTDVAGSSSVFERGFVTYSNQAKTQMLGVAPATLAAHGAVSEEVAAEMAQGARAYGTRVQTDLAQPHLTRIDLAVSITGIAGPGGSEFKPEGRVCFGLASPAGIRTETVDFGPLGRAQVRAAACTHALHLLAQALT
ncbi:CinA family protein [Rhodobacter sp. KR11]|uniref:CinA family protein n=1 Tax=Rhodobacter sp. KR11 TaxID=2974588 RepID=UPI0022213E12|nr:CinA family protein [Rhodobacter sp. KR11]MCW1919385.1 CinA family protein [Rhodobacter sp. KR11]